MVVMLTMVVVGNMLTLGWTYFDQPSLYITQIEYLRTSDGREIGERRRPSATSID